jgi:predicted hydrocarbon binding protein
MTTTTPIPGNYFAQRNYLKADPATGLLSSREGNRLIAIPEVLLESIHRSLRAEAGEATPLALYTFGFWWGGSVYDRMRSEIESYYRTTIGNMNAIEFLVMMREFWATHGLGNLTLDFTYRDRGLVQVVTTNSILVKGTDLGLKEGQIPSHHLEAGFIAAWFARWAGKELRACATDWGLGRSAIDLEETESFTQFLVGAADQIEEIEGWVKQGLRTTEILNRLTS